jgi:acetolactate synthase small subunit
MSPLAAPAPTAHPDAAGVACFSVHARAEPGIMPRVLELFAKRGLVPSSWHSSVTGPGERELTVDIQMRGMAIELADYVAACLRQIPDVEVVLTSRKH